MKIEKNTGTHWPFTVTIFTMKRHHQFSYAAVLQFSITILLGLVSFALCFAAEFKKSKKDDLRLNGKFCHLPRSQGFGLGIAALVLLFFAQINGNLFTCQKFRSRKHHHEGSLKTKFPNIAIISLILSWTSFGVAAILIGAATSMNQSQEFGEGWLDGECYIVKDGVFVGAAAVILVAVGSTISSAAMVWSKVQGDQQGRKVYAQSDSPAN